MNALEAKKQLLSCPGDTLYETLEEIGMSQVELAARLGRSVPKVNELLKGKAPLTEETAVRLEYVLNIPASLWLNLERMYRDELAEIRRMESLEASKAWLNRFPIGFMKKMSLLPNTQNKASLVESLLKFFQVASPKEWESIYSGKSVAFKMNLQHTSEPEAISVWLRLGELQAERLNLVKEFNKQQIREKLTYIAQLVYNMPKDWMKSLQSICADCGLALVYTPCISKAPIYGAARWIKNASTPLIQLTDRDKNNHTFWFSFYHELAHILYHGKKKAFIRGLKHIEPNKDKEDEADKFACRQLLLDKDRRKLLQIQNWNEYNIIKVSNKLKKHPGIIVGQLQWEKKLSYQSILNKLKSKVAFEHELSAN